jgi:formylglycine-generating enzyme required for sulfatase activity
MIEPIIEQFLSEMIGIPIHPISFLVELKNQIQALDLKYIEAANIKSSFYSASKESSENLAANVSNALFELASKQLYDSYNDLLKNKPVHVFSEKVVYQTITIDLPFCEELVLKEIPRGSFILGSERENDRPKVFVQVDSFFISLEPVTKKQWAAVCKLPKEQENLQGISFSQSTYQEASYLEAIEFCARLSKHTNLNITLPSESMWEFYSESYVGLSGNSADLNNKFDLVGVNTRHTEITSDIYYPNHLRNPKNGKPVL